MYRCEQTIRLFRAKKEETDVGPIFTLNATAWQGCGARPKFVRALESIPGLGRTGQRGESYVTR
jgi:hypothetical protein